MIMKFWINVPLLILQSMIMITYSVRHVSSTRIKVPILLLGLFCVLGTTGLQSHHHHPHNSSSSPMTLEAVEGYDPVESYYQLRRHYLTSTSRGDGSLSSSSTSWGSKNSGIRNSKKNTGEGQGGRGGYDHDHHHPRREHLHHQNSQTYNNHQTQVYHQQSSHNNLNHPAGPYDSNNHHNHHRCYVCLPPNKASREAKDILAMFSTREQAKIADCAQFGQQNSHEYEFPCPPTYGGCILRIHGPNISRACSRYRLNDCKRANAVEFCYCTQPLCNDIKQEPIRPWQRGQREGGESDDEDDSSGSSGDGGTPESDVAEPPSDSGVVHQYTTTTLDSSAPLANFNSEDEITEISNFSISNQASYLFCRLSPLLVLLCLLPFYLFS